MAILETIKEVFNLNAVNKEPVDIEADNEATVLAKVKFRRDESEKLLKSKTFEWGKQLRFFDGDHWEIAGVSIPRYKADIVINKFFAAVRSLVAFETDAKPDPEVEARIDTSDENYMSVKEGAEKVDAMIDYRWDMCNVPNTLTEIYYDRYIMDDGFGMYFWNSEIDDADFAQVKPSELMIAPGATCIDDAEYVILQKYRSRKWFQTYFPDVIDDIKFEGAKNETWQSQYQSPSVVKSDYENMAKVYHYFEDEVWITFTDKMILEKTKNQHWEFRTPDEQTIEASKENAILPPDFKPIKNHLLKPEKPIIHFKGYHLGGELYSRSLVKQVSKLNFAINKRKCQIQDNADGAQGQWLVDPSVPLDKVNMITSEPNLKIRINPALAQKVAGTPLPEFVFVDLQNSEQKFDDMMGHHDVSRGAQTSKRQTAKEAMLLRETDITPVRLLMRNSEVAITRLINGWVQLMKMYYDQPHFIGAVGTKLNEGAGQMLKRDEIPDSLSIKIKVGSSLPTSKESKRVEYQADLARGVLDPLTYLELMDYPNPEKILQRVRNWQQGIIGEQAPVAGGAPGMLPAPVSAPKPAPPSQ